MSSLVSIIMPVYNGGNYIREAIESVLNQSYSNWELLIINDGSTDDSKKIIQSYSDLRISYIEQANSGVSNARNRGLKLMKGDFFCFLDADDKFYTESISSRLKVFTKNKHISFVDGTCKVIDNTSKKCLRTYTPNFNGACSMKLIKLSEDVFFGPTWMIKNNRNFFYHFDEGQTHCEDLSFFLEISDQGIYDYTSTPILEYRSGNDSAMKNLKGLEHGYFQFLEKVKSKYPKRIFAHLGLRLRIVKIMFLSYLSARNYKNALLVTLKLVS